MGSRLLSYKFSFAKSTYAIFYIEIVSFMNELYEWSEFVVGIILLEENYIDHSSKYTFVVTLE